MSFVILGHNTIMYMKFYSTLITLVFAGFCLNAQTNPIRETIQKQKIVITEYSNTSPDAAEVIRILAFGNNKPPRNTSFTINFDQKIKSNNREPNIVAVIESGSLNLAGDVYYRGFDVSEFIFPASLNFTAQLNTRSGISGFFPLTAQIYSGKPENTSINYPDSDRVVMSVSLVQHSFRFGNTVISNLKNQVGIIDNYFSSVNDVDATFAKLQSINLNDFENFRMHRQRLLEVETMIANLHSRNIPQQLQLSQYDPAKFQEKLAICTDASIAKRRDFEYLMSTLHLTFYQRGLSLAQAGNLNRAQEYFKSSMEVNPLFAPALLQLALIDFRKNDLLETVCKADDILYGLYPDPDTKDRTLDLLQDVYESRIDRGNTNLQQRKNYYKAIDEFEEARRICEKYSSIRCNDELYEGIKLSKNGIYRDHLESARLLIQSNDLTKAEKRVKDAITYQYQNRKEIPSNSEALALLKGINQKRYNTLISKAKSFIDQRLYEAALTTFSEATELKNENDLVEDANFGNLVNSAARPRIIELLYEGEALVLVNDLGAAGDRYKKAGDLQQQYGFSTDKDINKHRESLRKSIFSKECINAQEAVDKAFKEGQTNVDAADYIAARNQFELAIKTADDFANCGIDISEVKAANEAIRPAATYIAIMTDFKIKQDNGDYREAIDLYNKATRYFMENKVASFGLVHELDKFTYIKEKGTGGLINYAAEMYTEQDDLEKGLILYKLLLSRNYDVKLLEGSLYNIGFKYGLKEKADNPGFKAKDLVKQYTSSDKRMKRFEKGFSKGYKN